MDKKESFMMKRKETKHSKRRLRKRKLAAKENKTGRVKDLRLQFEGIAAGKGRIIEERNSVEANEVREVESIRRMRYTVKKESKTAKFIMGFKLHIPSHFKT